MKLEESALSDLRAERDALLADFDAWQLRAGASGDLKQHNSQVGRVTTQLRELLDLALRSTVLGDSAKTVTLATLEPPRRVVSVVNAIWDFFRDKLTQRDTARYADHLGAADDLAWACYLPFMEARVAAVAAQNPAVAAVTRAKLKEPPLVSYTPEHGLFMQSRKRAFRPPGLSALDVEKFSGTLQRLPVPIITLPWSHARRALRLTLLAHEVGHVVADDLELNEEMSAKLAGLALKGEVARWTEWLPEVFADVFGTAALGVAYVDALAAFLAGPLSDVRAEVVSPGAEYPTRSLRVELCCATLEKMGIARYASWADAYGGASPVEYAEDAALVADALLNGPFDALNGKSVHEILGWSNDEETTAQLVAAALRENREPGVMFSVRRWLAGAAKAQRGDPAEYEALGVDAKVLTKIVKQRPLGVRAQRAASLRATPAATVTAPHVSPNDVAAARELAVYLGFIKQQGEEDE
jgi:hypothetical protein